MNTDKLIYIVKRKGSICAEDLKGTGIARTMLHYMANRGILRRVARGVYTLAGQYLALRLVLFAFCPLCNFMRLPRRCRLRPG